MHLRKNMLQLVCCRSCSMIYANPVPAEYATGEYYDQTAADYYLTPAKLRSDYAAVRFERELALFRNHCSGGAIFDVGCSSGAFLFQLKQRFPQSYDVAGMDASGPALDYAASRGITVLRGNFLEHDFRTQRFEAITFWAVLEHLMEPRSFLEKACSILKPGGHCFVLVPNLRSLAVRSLGVRYRYIYPQHLNYFTRSTLTRLVEERFAMVELCSTHFNPVVIWQDWRGDGKEISNQQRAELLERTTAYKQNPLLKPVKLLYRLSEKCLGRLNLADNLAAVLVRKG